MTKSRIQELAKKWFESTLTEQEREELESWYNKDIHDIQSWNLDADRETLKERLYNNILRKIDSEEDKALTLQPSGRILKLRRYAAASVILLLLATGLWYVMNKADVSVGKSVAVAKIDVPPGINAATLELADGTVVNLDTTTSGKIADQGDVVINKRSGQVSYVSKSKVNETKIVYNKIKTARGNQYNLTLADGTRVWLNSVSALKYPTSFSAAERVVELTGEAYFEVAKNKAKPFKVKVRGVEVEVLGTHFNVNAYEDENSIKTTLVEGAVKVWYNKSGVNITPGQQAELLNDAKHFKVREADVDKELAWQTGFFEFGDADLHSIMRQISRWYNVDVRFETEATGAKFGGRLSRNLNLGNVLKLLKTSGIDFSLEGNVLIVKSEKNNDQ